MCLKLTMKTPKRRVWRCSGVLIVNFEHILRFALASLLLILNMYCRLSTLVSLGLWQTFLEELFCENSERLKMET